MLFYKKTVGQLSVTPGGPFCPAHVLCYWCGICWWWWTNEL